MSNEWVWPWVFWPWKSGQIWSTWAGLWKLKSWQKPRRAWKSESETGVFRCEICGSDCEWMEEGNKNTSCGSQLASRVLLIDLDVFQNVYKPTASTTTFRVCKKRPFWGPKNISSKLQENSNPTGEVFRGTNRSYLLRGPPGSTCRYWEHQRRCAIATVGCFLSNCHTWNRWKLCCHFEKFEKCQKPFQAKNYPNIIIRQ